MLLASLLVAWYTLGGDYGSEVAHGAAVYVGIGVVLSAIADSRMGLSNLVRADLFAILSFYFLTLFEFLFPQENYDTLVTAQATHAPVIICLWALAGLAVGRHFVRRGRQPFRRILTTAISPDRMMTLFLLCVVGGYANMLLACHFNVYEMVDAFTWARFSQPWSRGRLGDWKALFDEIGMVLFLIPPMSGIILARRRNYSSGQLVFIVFFLLFTLFYGYTSGTRHIFDSYLVTFLIGYAFATQKARRHELLYVAAVCAGLLIFSTVTMVKFREVGLKGYLDGTADIEEVKNPDVLAADQRDRRGLPGPARLSRIRDHLPGTDPAHPPRDLEGQARGYEREHREHRGRGRGMDGRREFCGRGLHERRADCRVPDRSRVRVAGRMVEQAGLRG
jgi:hypothetical protein